MVEGSGLENRQGVHAPSWVRIPPLPPDTFAKLLELLNNTHKTGIVPHRFSHQRRPKRLVPLPLGSLLLALIRRTNLPFSEEEQRV